MIIQSFLLIAFFFFPNGINNGSLTSFVEICSGRLPACRFQTANKLKFVATALPPQKLSWNLNNSCDEITLVSDALNRYIKKSNMQDTIFIIHAKLINIKKNYKAKCVKSDAEILCNLKYRESLSIEFYEKENEEKIVCFHSFAVGKKGADSIPTRAYGTIYCYHYKVVKNRCKLVKLTYSGY